MIGTSIRKLEVVESTNSLLKAEAEVGKATEGAVVMADHQTAGRGRLDRQWEAPPGKGLLFSVLIYPEIPTEKIALISLIASLAMLEGLSEKLDSTGLQLKWPNDILHNDRKLCGILCDSGTDASGRQFVVVGVGLNVNQDQQDFPSGLLRPAISMKLITHREHSRDAFLKSALESFDRCYRRLKAEGVDWIAETWLDRSELFGKTVTVLRDHEEISGTVDGLEPDGALRLRLRGGELITIHSGDVF